MMDLIIQGVICKPGEPLLLKFMTLLNLIIKSENIETHSKSNIKGNIKTKIATLGGTLKGNVQADHINIKKTANVNGELNQKILSIEEGATLKIKTETYK